VLSLSPTVPRQHCRGHTEGGDLRVESRVLIKCDQFILGPTLTRARRLSLALAVHASNFVRFSIFPCSMSLSLAINWEGLRAWLDVIASIEL